MFLLLFSNSFTYYKNLVLFFRVWVHKCQVYYNITIFTYKGCQMFSELFPGFLIKEEGFWSIFCKKKVREKILSYIVIITLKR